MNRRDPSLCFEFGTQLRIAYPQRKLLLLGRLSGGEVRREEVLERCRDLGLADGRDVLEGLLSGLECMLANKLGRF